MMTLHKYLYVRRCMYVLQNREKSGLLTGLYIWPEEMDVILIQPDTAWQPRLHLEIINGCGVNIVIS